MYGSELFGRARDRVAGVVTTGRLLVMIGLLALVGAAVFGYVKGWTLAEFSSAPASATGLEQMAVWGGTGGGLFVATTGIFVVAWGSG